MRISDWSSDVCSSDLGRSSPQYWHSKESRRNTLKRVKAGRRSRLTYCFSEITLGSFISKLGERTTVSYSDTLFTRSRKTALMASCQDHKIGRASCRERVCQYV